MSEILMIVIVVLLAILLIFQLISLKDRSAVSQTLARVESLDRSIERVQKAMREDNSVSREEAARYAKLLREEVGAALKGANDTLIKTLNEIANAQRGQLEDLRKAVEQKLTSIQQQNEKKLEQMRQTVDEKLQGTLEKRLGESFKLVNERLQQVYEGLGEMKTLASGVGDLKKVLTNVKVRGTWGEIQLGNLLEQVLSPDQYEQNVATKKGSNERVEFAIKLPGRDGQEDDTVWLPVDAKFPKEDYERLIEASERADASGVEEAGRQLEARIKASAKEICDKYLHPPGTTDFAIMFLPSEGLYAEVLRRPGLVETLQRDCRVSVAGPTTLAALLNSLQMGFRTLAIQKRSSDVWMVLGAVKSEFGRFGDVIAKVKKKLQEASNVMDSASVRSRAIERKLRDVEQLPATQAKALIGIEETGDEDES
jgi:DNA recombination protein RmuC